MKTIGLIDDRDTQRRTFRRQIELLLDQHYPDWKIIDSAPFIEMDDYRPWILENEISILILDERLYEAVNKQSTHVTYNGSDLVKYLRDTFKDFPIYCITSYEIPEESLSYFSLRLNRAQFQNDKLNYLNSFIRTGTSFYKDFQNDLSRIGELSEKVATSQANESEKLELTSIQTKLVIPHLSNEIINKEEHLDKVEQHLNRFQSLREQLEAYINSKK